MVSRRTFLLGALGTAVLAGGGSVVAIEDGVLPGRMRLADLAGACDVDAVPPAGRVGAITSGRFASFARGRDLGWSLALPPGHPTPAGLPVALVLHGRGEDHSSGFAQLKLYQFLAAYVASRRYTVCTCCGRWRRQLLASTRQWRQPAANDHPGVPSDAWPAGVTNRRDRRAWLVDGWVRRPAFRPRSQSTHTFGRWRFGRHYRRRGRCQQPCAVRLVSSQCARRVRQRADFARYGDLANQPDVGETPLYVRCGATDAFTGETKRYRASASPPPAGGISKGCHTGGYWRSVAAAQISFVGSHLT